MIRRDNRIQMLPGLATTPPVFLRKLQEMEDDIEHVVCVVQMKDGHTEAYWTEMTLSDHCWLRHVLNEDSPK